MNIKEKVQEYYGEVLSSSKDLKTDACCPIDSLPNYLKPLISNIHNEILEKFYGCGSPIPNLLEGKKILDLGCGTGKDVYTISQLIGEEGKVIGVDMTEQQLSVAKKHQIYHQKEFKLKKSNVEFHQGFIEDLSFLADESIDIVVSNCVINLSDNKEKLFKEIFRVLKKGGELCFADIFAESRLSKEQKLDKVLLGECLGGALYIEDFRRILANNQIFSYRIISENILQLYDEEIKAKVKDTIFNSITLRTFKCQFEDREENYAQKAVYNGGIKYFAEEFTLDNSYVFKKGEEVPVSGNIATILEETRYKDFFIIIGDKKIHYGLFKQERKKIKSSCC